ncbi:MAG: PEP-CTERM sorting domain-containing protein [Cyanothece sp. SIO1E1]|nr:PEP-CTERM sorting domain-containing protein [Cyanothece sp. SIO1E1]
MLNRLSLVLLSTVGVTVSTVSIASSAAVAASINPDRYADEVVSYEKGWSKNWGNSLYNNPETALGEANWTSEMVSGGKLGAWKGDIGVSLGKEGTLTLGFTDNYLTGSGNSDSDLWIFEIGRNPEDVVVEISSDGNTWYRAGVADKQDYAVDTGIGIDIDPLLSNHTDLDRDSLFSFVRLTDNGTNGYGGAKSGADIDAVAALSSVSKSDVTDVPEPGMVAALGVMGVGTLLRRKQG